MATSSPTINFVTSFLWFPQNEQNSFLVDFKLKDVEKRFYLKYPGFYGSKWAEPDTEDLKKKMKAVYTSYKLALNKAEQAKKDVLRFDIKKVIPLLVQRLSLPQTLQSSY